MHIVLMSLYDSGAAGIRSLSSFLKSHGHRVSLLFYGELGRTHMEFHQFSKIEYSQNVPRWCDENDRTALMDLLNRLNPDVVGISLRSGFLPTAVELTEEIKRRISVPILWGGIHPTICPDESIQHADWICRGEGEHALLDLIEALRKGREIRDIPNLWVKQDGRIFKNDLRPLCDPNQLPFADFSGEDKYYIHAQPFQTAMYSIMTARGCPFHCTFCCNSILRGIYRGKGPYLRRRSIENVIEELVFAKNTHSIAEVIFQDEVFIDDPDWLYPFLDEYEKKIALPFACYLHTQYVEDSLVQRLKKAGLYTACLGIQSGSEKVRQDLYRRKQTNSDILRSARILNPQIDMAYDLIVDSPFETREDLEEAIHLFLQFPHPFRIQVITLTFFPKYPITEIAMEKGLIRGPDADDLSDGMLMAYNDRRPKFIQSLYFLIAATQHSSVDPAFIRKALEDERLLNEPLKLFRLLDGMIKDEDYIQDYRKRERALEFLEGVKKVLLIPTGEAALILEMLRTLKEKFPRAHIFIPAGPFPKKYRAILPWDQVSRLNPDGKTDLQRLKFPDQGKGFHLLGMDWGWIRMLRKMNFDLALLFHGDMAGKGTIHAEGLALLSGAKRTVIVKPDRSLVRLDLPSFFREAVKRKIGLL